MIYCFTAKNYEGKERTNREISYAIAHKAFIYYDKNNKVFKDEQDNIVDISNKEIFPVSFVPELNELISSLLSNGAIIPNNLEDINKIENWPDYIETKRHIIKFEGRLINDPEFLNYLYEIFKTNPEVFLKTIKKDYNGLIDLSELFDKDSDLRKAFELHLDEEFIISEKVDINEDELGREEYRAFIYKGKIMNISRITDTTYHKIPQDLIDYIEELLQKLPSNFPKTFTLDIFSYQHMYDVLELNPIEASGRYLYNSVFNITEDLTHQDIEHIPSEKDKEQVSYETNHNLQSSTLVSVPKSFAKDYDDIKKYGKRVDGFVHIYGLPEGVKIDIDELFKKSESLMSDADLSPGTDEKRLSLTNPNS